MAVFYDNGTVPGAWREAMFFLSPFARIEPYIAAELMLDAFEGGTDTDTRAHCPAVARSFHETPDSLGGQHDHD